MTIDDVCIVEVVRHRHGGQYNDAESGLIYLRTRYYDPSTGQFLTRDPLSAVTGSAYGYVNDNPLNGVDPMGLSPWGWIKHHAAVVAAVGAVAAVVVVSVATLGTADALALRSRAVEH